MKSIILLFALMAFSANVLAQNKKYMQPPVQVQQQKTWDSEPNTFLGISLGLPLAESMVQCPDNYFQNGFKSLCWQDGHYTSHIVSNTPNIGLDHYVVDLSEVKGVVASISFQIEHRDFSKMAEMLRSKYGLPTTEKVDVVQNGMGAKFDNILMTWIGKNVTLSLASRADKIDRSLVHIYTNEYIESKKFNAEKYKDNL